MSFHNQISSYKMKNEDKKLDQQSQHELRVFKQFASAYLCSDGFLSIEKREPPEPDIYCTSQDSNPIAFELCEIIDEKLAKTLRGSVKIEQIIQDRLERLPDSEKQIIKQNFTDAQISLKFYEAASKNSILSSAENILGYLSTLRLQAQAELFCLKKETFRHYVSQDDYLNLGKQIDTHEEHILQAMRSQSGDAIVYLKPDENLAEVVEWVRVTRGDFRGPLFHVVSHHVWSSFDLSVKRIEDKFNKEYKTECRRIELLCYFELQPEVNDDACLPKIKAFVTTNIKSSPFEKVWIYSVTRNEVVYVS